MDVTEIAFAKINLALHVRRRRDDGYHELETLFAFCEEGDVLTATLAETLSLTISGPCAAGLSNGDDNLIIRAAKLLKEAAGIAKGAAIHLDKRLPIAAGIGGGSADAAAALRLLSRLWDVQIPEPLAAALGADVPACIASMSVRGEGVGDLLSPISDERLIGRPILLVNPVRPCPTGPVFAAWNGIDRGPLGDWQAGRNDLQAAAIALVPEIGETLALLNSLPQAKCTRMSGSGATCFALFDDVPARNTAADHVRLAQPSWWVMQSILR